MAQLAFFSVNNAPSRVHRRGKVSNWAIFYWKCPAENAGNGISETLNWNIFWGNMPTEPPTLGHLRCYNVYSPCEYTFKISRYAPEVAILFRPRKLFHAYNWLSKPWLLLKLTQKKIKIIERNCKIEPEFQFWVFKMLTGHSVPDRESFIAFRHKFRPPLFQLLIMRSVFLKCKGWVYMLN